jgi:Skp family chaperone for outer membrane proteins
MYTTRAVAAVRSRAIVAPVQARSRLIHSTPAAYKTVTEKVTEVADKVNKSVGKGLADAIDKGEKATHAAKDTIQSVTKDTATKTEQSAKETATQAKQKTYQAEAGAREAKRDFERELKK